MQNAPLGAYPQTASRPNWRPVIPSIGLIVCLLGAAEARHLSLSHLNYCTTTIGMVAASALEMYASDNQGHYPASMRALVSGNYLKRIPTCPAAATATYDLDYQVSPKGDEFTICCSGNHHWLAWRILGVEGRSDVPAYNSRQGLIRGKRYLDGPAL